jgi:hypothetical protein
LFCAIAVAQLVNKIFLQQGFTHLDADTIIALNHFIFHKKVFVIDGRINIQSGKKGAQKKKSKGKLGNFFPRSRFWVKQKW